MPCHVFLSMRLPLRPLRFEWYDDDPRLPSLWLLGGFLTGG